MTTLVSELFAYMGARKKWWLAPILLVLLVIRRAPDPGTGIGRGAVHLHRVLIRPGVLPMRLLGISAFYHDSAAALIEDGRIVAAAQEERFTPQEA